MNRIVLFFLLFSQFVFGQDSNFPGQKKLAKEQVLYDYQVLIQSIESIHPNHRLFLTDATMDDAKNSIIENIDDGLTTDEFHIRIRQYLRKIGCGHLVAKPSKDWYTAIQANAQLLPFSLYLLDGKAYIKETYDRDSLLYKGVQILKIDERDLSDIFREMQSIQERDGNTNSYTFYRVQKLFATYYLFLYGQKEKYSITIKNNDNMVENLIIHPAKKRPGSKTPINHYPGEITMDNARFYVDQNYPQLGVLDINRFSTKGFKKFYNSVFKEIELRKLEYLVIDLRDNGGGYFPNGNNLMKYLLDEKFIMHFNRPKSTEKKPKEAHLPFFSKMTNLMFNLMPDSDKEDPRRNYALKNNPKSKNHFNGDLYILTNGGTFSLGSYVSTYLKHRGDATFIGSETGGGEFGSNAVINYDLTLPESGIRVDIPYYFLDHQIPKGKNFGQGVQPDHEIKYSIEDTLNNRDKEMEKVYELLKK